MLHTASPGSLATELPAALSCARGWGRSSLPLPSMHPNSGHSSACPDYRSHRVAPPAWFPWALIFLLPPLSPSGLERG